MTPHDWLLVAPWWHWPRQGGVGRDTRPALQKYDTAQLVDTFLVDPQLRLKFLDAVDRVATYQGGSTFQPPTRTVTDRRKLFLPTHSRHYLLVCSLHCDVPGFPAVERGQVCESGYVIRRRRLHMAGKAGPARAHVQAVAAARRALAAVDAQMAAARMAPAVAGMRLAGLQLKRDAAATVLAERTAALREWAAAAGVATGLEGWYPRRDGEGEWRTVDEVGDEVGEVSFPLYPLVAPDNQPGHDAAGQTVFFGLVTTGSSDVDAHGDPRFDATSVYEARCWVRRHDPRCPRTTNGRDCHGEVVWSEPTERFGLAAPFDLRGTANRPVVVQLPDFKALQAEAGSAPGGVQFRSPPGSEMGMAGPNNGSEAICTFSIPLITIVATFVFRLFLPVVVFLFQLWWMLLLKFCIPPEIEVEGELAAALDFTPAQLDADLTLKAKWELAVGAAVNGQAGWHANGDVDLTDPPGSKATTQGSTAQRVALARRILRGDGVAAPVDDRVYEERVERHEVLV